MVNEKQNTCFYPIFEMTYFKEPEILMQSKIVNFHWREKYFIWIVEEDK